MKKTRPSSLGKGLSSLLGPDTPTKSEQPTTLPVSWIRGCESQPRKHFGDEELNELISSIQQNGVLQPIIVRPVENKPYKYEIIAGERRWRASQRLGLQDIPVVIKEVNNQQALELAIIENVQRENLTAVEEAEAFHALRTEHNYTQEELAQVIGKSRAYIANSLRLLQLPDNIRDYINEKKITAGHARVLLSVPNPQEVAQQIIDKNMSVRESEKLLKESKFRKSSGAEKSTRPKPPRFHKPNDPNFEPFDVQALEDDLTQILNTKVTIDFKNNAPVLMIHCSNYEMLDRYIEKLTMEPKKPLSPKVWNV